MSVSRGRVAGVAPLVHGMERDLVEADWPVLTEDEVRSVLSRSEGSRRRDGDEVRITWSSPRPMSAAALVSCSRGELFVKRHHRKVREPARLRLEHAFAQHLRDQGEPVARVLVGAGGETVWQEGDFVYEIHEKAHGVDLYRDTPSWHPFVSRDHARAAGRALAHFHQAARGFTASATAPGVLTNSMVVLGADDPPRALRHLIDSRPALSRALTSRDLGSDFARDFESGVGSVAPLLGRLESQWGHGDWHPSNLTWTSEAASADVASVLDLGLANRTTTVHDLAIALERSVVDWLDLALTGEIRADLPAVDSLLDGYESVRELTVTERVAFLAVLPVVHLEFALSEVEYFADVVHSEANLHLAYDGYLLGHARWFHSIRGVELMRHLQRRWSL